MSLRAVLFDFDDTLCDVSVSREERARRAYRRLVDEGVAVTWSGFWGTINSPAADGFYRRGMEGAVSDLGLEGTQLGRECVDLWVFKGAEDLICVRPGCTDVLERLRERYRLGVITNGPQESQAHKFTVSGLAEYFDVFLTSEAAGALKPDPAIYHRALELMGVLPAEAVYVGDHLDLDVIGAQEAGMRAIWYDPGDRKWFPDIVPDAVIRRLEDLPAALERLERHLGS